MTMTTSEAKATEDIVTGVRPALVGGASGAPSTTPVHAEGSTYTCPACRQIEDGAS